MIMLRGDEVFGRRKQSVQSRNAQRDIRRGNEIVKGV